MSKLIVRIKGGLGNQLFCYAAARRLSLVNDAELVLDDVTGFSRDAYGSCYRLDHFRILARKATATERLEPLQRYRRVITKWFSRQKTFSKRCYVEQEGIDFDERLLTLKITGTKYLDGLWQSEGYFKDQEEIIRKDLEIIPPMDSANQDLARKIQGCQSIAVHVRWFDKQTNSAEFNVAPGYYARALAFMEQKVSSPYYFLFSDDPQAASRLRLPEGRSMVVYHNQAKEMAYADLWLMKQCKHFIMANSTFSWWGAWLGTWPDKMVVAPRMIQKEIVKTNWGFKGLLPSSWVLIDGKLP